MIIVGLLLLLLLASSVTVVREFERAVVLRLGRLVPHRGPGVVLVIPGLEKMVRVDLRGTPTDVPSQDVITRDNVSVKVNAVLVFRVVDPSRAVMEVDNYVALTLAKAQTALRSVCGQVELDELLSDRERINDRIQAMLDEATEAYGVKVVSVELKHIDLPQEMKRAMARQAEAERDRRAKVINAEGEFQASARLSEAAAVMSAQPMAVQLRFLQTLSEIASEHTSTLVLPVPVDLLAPFVELARRRAEAGEDPKPAKAAPTAGEAGA